MADFNKIHWDILMEFSYCHGIGNIENLSKRLDKCHYTGPHSERLIAKWRDEDNRIPERAMPFVADAFRLSENTLREALAQKINSPIQGNLFIPDKEKCKDILRQSYSSRVKLNLWQLDALISQGRNTHCLNNREDLNQQLSAPLLTLTADGISLEELDWPDAVQFEQLAKTLGFQSGRTLADCLWDKNKASFLANLRQYYGADLESERDSLPPVEIETPKASWLGKLALVLLTIGLLGLIASHVNKHEDTVPSVRPVMPNANAVIGKPYVTLTWVDDKPAANADYSLILLRRDGPDQNYIKEERDLKELDRKQNLISTEIRLKENGEYKWTVRRKTENNNDDDNKLLQYLHFYYWESLLAKIQKAKSLTVAVVSSEMDRFLKKENNHYTGFDERMMQLIAEGLGKNININKLDTDWPDLLSTVESGKADLAISSMTNLKSRVNNGKVEFTVPYFHPHQAFYHLKDHGAENDSQNLPELLKHKRIGVVAGSSNELLAQYLLQENNAPRYDFAVVTRENITKLTVALSQGEIDYMLTDCELVQRSPGDNLAVLAIIPESHKQQYIENALFNVASGKVQEGYVMMTSTDATQSLSKKISEILESPAGRKQRQSLEDQLYAETPGCRESK